MDRQTAARGIHTAGNTAKPVRSGARERFSWVRGHPARPAHIGRLLLATIVTVGLILPPNLGSAPSVANAQTAAPPPTATPTATPTSSPSPAATPTATSPATTPTATSPAATPTATSAASPSATATATSTPATSPTATPVAPAAATLVELPLLVSPPLDPAVAPDLAAGDEQFLASATTPGAWLWLFGQRSGSADVRLHHPGSGTSLGFALPGVASSRLVAGAVATAAVGALQVRWTSYADRLKEDVILAARPTGDAVTFSYWQRGLATEPDGQGGYLARDGDGRPIFQLLAPTVADALGQPGGATLILDPAAGTLVVRLDPAFLATAVYPITVDPTVVYTGGEVDSTGYNNAERLIQDPYGKLLLVSTNQNQKLVFSWSNNAGTSWTTSVSSLVGSFDGPTWALGPDSRALHLAYRLSAGGIEYRQLQVQRDPSNNIGLVRPPPAGGRGKGWVA